MNFGGQTGAVLISQEPEFIPGQGWTLRYRYQGVKAAIDGLAPSLIPYGYDFTVDEQGPYHTLDAVRQTEEAGEQGYTDKFRVRAENVTKSIWSLESVSAEMDLWIANEAAAGRTKRVEDYKKIVTDAAIADTNGGAAALQSQLPILTYPRAHSVFQELGRGADSYEDVYFTLTRTRVVGLQYNGRVALKNTSVIYTTAELFSEFALPAFTHILMPATPAITPANSRWGWRSRVEEVRFIEGRKVEITQDFAFAAWSTNIYSTFSP